MKKMLTPLLSFFVLVSFAGCGKTFKMVARIEKEIENPKLVSGQKFDWGKYIRGCVVEVGLPIGVVFLGGYLRLIQQPVQQPVQQPIRRLVRRVPVVVPPPAVVRPYRPSFSARVWAGRGYKIDPIHGRFRGLKYDD
jgi:hypothetical protein